MADRPILFSGPMVRALLAGTKTQTRRPVKSARVFATPETKPFTLKGAELDRALQNASRFRRLDGNGWFWEADAYEWQAPSERTGWMAHIGHAPGDRLWVKETWRPIPHAFHPWDMEVIYNANGEHRIVKDGEFGENDWTMPKAAQRGNVSSLFMPRWASRLTLTITNVRVERLQDITEADALAEGMTQATADAILSTDELQVYATTHIVAPQARGRILYETIWDQINGAGSWDANPWVAAYSFTVEHGNIDQLRAAP